MRTRMHEFTIRVTAATVRVKQDWPAVRGHWACGRNTVITRWNPGVVAGIGGGCQCPNGNYGLPAFSDIPCHTDIRTHFRSAELAVNFGRVRKIINHPLV